MQESQRQQKVAGQIQKDISEILGREGLALMGGTMVSVSKVRMSPDLLLAKVYLSVFPFERSDEALKHIKSKASMIRFELGKRVKNQLRLVPELAFIVDDSLEYIENLEKLMK